MYGVKIFTGLQQHPWVGKSLEFFSVSIKASYSYLGYVIPIPVYLLVYRWGQTHDTINKNLQGA